MPWRQLLLESHSIAVISAAGVGLLAFPGADLAKSAQPALVRLVTAEPIREPIVVPSKGPPVRHTSLTLPGDAAPPSNAAAAPARLEIDERSSVPSADAAPARSDRAFEGCLQAHEQAACRRAFEAAIERQGGFSLAPIGNRLGAQPLAELTPLAFEDGPQWRRTLEAVSQDGITFKRLRRGGDHELTFGISRDGVLGFTLEERRE